MFKKRLGVSQDLLKAIAFLVLAYLFASFVDLFEWLYSFTRQHEGWELDEILLLLIVAPLPLSWFAYRQMKRASREILRRAEYEKALTESSKMKSLGVLAGGVAHEINNQLLPITTMADLLCKRMDKDDPDYRKMEIIQKSAERTRDTVEKILIFSRNGEEVGGRCDLAEMQEKLEPLLSATCPSNVTLQVDVSACQGTVPVSATDILGILVNLFSNAVDAFDNNAGTITITASMGRSGDEVCPIPMKSDRYVKLSVVDNGPGIEHSVQGKVFDPFFTTKAPGQGIGLGLSIAFSTIRDAGGTVTLQSEPGHGSQFDIYLPVK